MNAIEIEELTRIFKRRRAVDQLSLTVRAGRAVRPARSKRRRENHYHPYAVRAAAPKRR